MPSLAWPEYILTLVEYGFAKKGLKKYEKVTEKSGPTWPDPID